MAGWHRREHFCFLVLQNPGKCIDTFIYIHRGGSRAAATSKMERFVIIVNGFQPLTIITKCSILDVAAVLDPLLIHIKAKKKKKMVLKLQGKIIRVNLRKYPCDKGFLLKPVSS